MGASILGGPVGKWIPPDFAFFFVLTPGAIDRIEAELEQIFPRVVFNVLVGNRDDHLRNHAFIREPSGWRLSPAYDVNPAPAKSEHALRLDESTASPNLDAALATSEYYRLENSRAKKSLKMSKAKLQHGEPRPIS